MESQSIALPTELTPPPANQLPANPHQALLSILEEHSEFLSLPNLPACILQFNHSNRLNGDSGRIRTRDPRLRRALLYPTELPSHRKTYYFTAKTSPQNRLSIGLEGRCSIQLSYGQNLHCNSHTRMGRTHPLDKDRTSFKFGGRGRRIRTLDPLVPNQMRYQTALCPDKEAEFYVDFKVSSRPHTALSQIGRCVEGAQAICLQLRQVCAIPSLPTQQHVPAMF